MLERSQHREPGGGELPVELALVAQHLEQRGVAHRDARVGTAERGAKQRERLELVVGRGQHQADVLLAAQRAHRVREGLPLRDGRDAPREVREGRGERRVQAVGDHDPEAVAFGEQPQHGEALESASRDHEDRREARVQGPPRGRARWRCRGSPARRSQKASHHVRVERQPLAAARS